MNNYPSPTLFIVATPIGNLLDMSDRVKEVFLHADWIAAEDTRMAQRLLATLDLKKKKIPITEHSSQRQIANLIASLSEGGFGVYVSDAGTPCISDPGAKLVEQAVEAGIRVVPIPGPSALTAIVSVAGVSSNTISFLGFFPRTSKDRKNFCKNLQSGLIVFLETPHRIRACLEVLAHHFPGYRLVIGRELTKRNEEVLYGSTEELFQVIQSRESVKGEFVLALHIEKAVKKEGEFSSEQVDDLLDSILDLGANQKVALRVAQFLGCKRRDAYNRVLAKKKMQDN